MRFISAKGAPDIPLEVLNVQEDDKLIFFCGAGISYPAGLPGFGELVDKTYKMLNDEPDPLETEAINKNLFDRTFDLLERRYQKSGRADNFLVRKSIIECLQLNSSANLDTHVAILELAKTKDGGVRLVTTNFDRGFLLANAELNKSLDSAPKLPVPKPHKWKSLVHIHGIIDEENEPNGKNLVITSGDFGAAYLTERWASRFVSEIFRHFTVIFVGYSIEDPVIRYITDAIAADQRSGYELANLSYVFAGTDGSASQSTRAAWEAKGVIPILYQSENHHEYLHDTLVKWAEHRRDGLRGIERIIRTKAQFPPLPPYEDDETKGIIEIIKQQENIDGTEPSGHPAKVFSELEPVPPIEWLPVFDQYGLLGLPTKPAQCSPVVDYNAYPNVTLPNNVTWNLWKWLSNHLEQKLLVQWVLDKGGLLHPRLLDFIRHKLRHEPPPSEPYFSFWRMLTSDFLLRDNPEDVTQQDIISSLRKKSDQLIYREFVLLLQPRLKLNRYYELPDEFMGSDNEDDYQESTRLYDADVVILLSEWNFNQLKECENYPKSLVPILSDITQALNATMRLWGHLGHADRLHDRSSWDMASIAPHPQNNRFNNWVILIELCRDVWDACFEDDPVQAETILNLWKSIDYPVFRRLVLHAYTTRSEI